MPRYFFNIRYRSGLDGLAVDPEGGELADLKAAREYALAQAQDMIKRTRTDLVRDWMVCSFEILDENRQPVLTVPFSDTVPEVDWD